MCLALCEFCAARPRGPGVHAGVAAAMPVPWISTFEGELWPLPAVPFHCRTMWHALKECLTTTCLARERDGRTSAPPGNSLDCQSRRSHQGMPGRNCIEICCPASWHRGRTSQFEWTLPCLPPGVQGCARMLRLAGTGRGGKHVAVTRPKARMFKGTRPEVNSGTAAPPYACSTAPGPENRAMQ